MKTPNKIWLIGFPIMVLIGVGIGYLLFGMHHSDSRNMDSHNHEAMTSSGSEAAAEAAIWTCSMHPQIRQNEPGDCPLCGMDLIPLESGSSEDSPVRLTMTEESIKLANIQTTVIGESSGSNGESTGTTKEILLTGKVKADETLMTNQTAHVGGRIEQLFVTYTGENVRKGQKIASVYSPELVAAQKELFEAKKLQNQIPGLYNAARNKLKLWKLSESTIQQIEQRGVVKTEIDMYADVSGVVMNKYVNLGDHVKQGGILYEVMNLNTVWVLFDVYEKDLQWVKTGNLIEFTIAAYPTKTYKGRITFIDPVINPITRVATARVEINNSGGRLKPDMFAKGTLKASPKVVKKSASEITLTVPKTAVLWTGKESVVYVKEPNSDVPIFEYKAVTLGTDLGNSYAVESGLQAGDEVVTNGAFRIDASAQLSNKSSMMNRHIEVKKEEQKDIAVPVPDFVAQTPDEFKAQLQAVITAYLDLKNTLVATDFEQAEKAGQAVQAAFEKTDMMLLKDEAHNYWMQQHKGLTAHLDLLKNAKDVEAQRQQFSPISELLTNAAKAFGITGDELYVQFCPMAFDNTGGFWLSQELQIQNPYFGDKMLKCGVVKDTIGE